MSGVKNILEKIKKFFSAKTGGNEYDRNIAMYRRKKKIKIIIALVVIVLIGVVYKIYSSTVTYTTFSETIALEIDDGAGSQYVQFGDFFVKYGSDGIAYVNGDETIWSQAYEMANPMVNVCDEYVAVADKESNTIYVFNEQGSEGKITTSYPIISIEVANQGVVAALLEEDTANYIEVYDKDGTELISHKTLLNGNGYPLSFSLSDDGTKMAVSYVCITTGVMESKVLFYNFSGVGQNEVDRMVGGFNHYESTVIPVVKFLDNNTAVAIGDNVLSIYRMREKPTLETEIAITNEMTKIFYDDEHIGLVFEDSDTGNQIVNVYNTDGKLVMEENIDMDFETIKLTSDSVLVYDDMSCKIISFGGRVRFEYRFKETIVEMLPTDSFREYLLITNNEVRKIKIK